MPCTAPTTIQRRASCSGIVLDSLLRRRLSALAAGLRRSSLGYPEAQDEEDNKGDGEQVEVLLDERLDLRAEEVDEAGDRVEAGSTRQDRGDDEDPEVGREGTAAD